MGNRGFTLLEVMVALAIMALALTAIVGINGNAITTHDYSKRVTVATMLARSKMVDLESHFNEEGFTSEFDQTMDGDFSQEGWSDFRWRAEIIKPDIDGGRASGMVQNLVQQFTGDAEQQASAATGGGPTPVAAGASAAMMAQFAPMLESQVTQLTTTLEQSVREVRLQVYWNEGRREESVDVTTHFVVLPGTSGTNIPGQNNGPPPPAPPGDTK